MNLPTESNHEVCQEWGKCGENYLQKFKLNVHIQITHMESVHELIKIILQSTTWQFIFSQFITMRSEIKLFFNQVALIMIYRLHFLSYSRSESPFGGLLLFPSWPGCAVHVNRSLPVESNDDLMFLSSSDINISYQYYGTFWCWI